MYNANLFEIRSLKPLHVNTYSPVVQPQTVRRGHFYNVLGKYARYLTRSQSIPVISEAGQIKVLDAEIPDNLATLQVPLEGIGEFRVDLGQANHGEIGYADSPHEYERLICRTIDVGLVDLLEDAYYKYHDLSPYIVERGEGYFDEKLRKDIGIVDGRRFYRGVRKMRGLPHLLVNREIELRSWGDLLNEINILARTFSQMRKTDFDFHNPPEGLVRFVNRALAGRTASNRIYSANKIVIRDITWDKRADDRVINGETSIVEYQKLAHGFSLRDPKQPLVRYNRLNQSGQVEEQFQAPELIVMGHTFKDLSTRVGEFQLSQVFDIVHPHCGEQQRRIVDFVRKVDQVLREKFNSLYPAKFEFSTVPADITENVTGPHSIGLRFAKKDVELQPPYGTNFYRLMPEKEKFAVPVSRDINAVAISKPDQFNGFLKELQEEFHVRNGVKLILEQDANLALTSEGIGDADLVISFLSRDDPEGLRRFKSIVINQLGKAHQNVTPQNATSASIRQLVMQLTLKLGGYPWLLSEAPDLLILSVHTYRNPFDQTRFYAYNLMDGRGRVLFQSTPYEPAHTLNLLREIGEKVSDTKRLLVLSTFDDLAIEEYVKKEVYPAVSELTMLKVLKNDNLRIFSTYAPSSVSAPRRRRDIIQYSVESYEAAPQGVILKGSDSEFYAVTTASRKIGTYHRGCPTGVRIDVLFNQGLIDLSDSIEYLLQLCSMSRTSGHTTRLPAPLYYLGLFAQYAKLYGVPSNPDAFKTLFYV